MIGPAGPHAWRESASGDTASWLSRRSAAVVARDLLAETSCFPPAVILLNSIVKRIKWRRGKAEIEFQSLSQRANLVTTQVVSCRRVVVTVPLGVLQAKPAAKGAIRFDKEPCRIFNAARALRFGQVYRVTFRFSHAFWEDEEKLQRAGFLVSREKQFSTWWTTHPFLSPLLTAWTAGWAAEDLDTSDPKQIATLALASLKRILKRAIPAPEGKWNLVRMHGDQKRENWLLIKSRDDESRDDENGDFLENLSSSVKTGRTMDEIADGQGAAGKKHLEELMRRYPEVEPATLVDSPPGGADWVHEIKYDGYRLLGFVSKRDGAAAHAQRQRLDRTFSLSFNGAGKTQSRRCSARRGGCHPRHEGQQ